MNTTNHIDIDIDQERLVKTQALDHLAAPSCTCITKPIPDGHSRVPDPECAVHNVEPGPDPCLRCGGQTSWVGDQSGRGRGHQCKTCDWTSPRASTGGAMSRLEIAGIYWPKIAAGEQVQWAEPPARGVSHLAALAMVVLDLDVVHRATLRALLPPGAASGKNNRLAWALKCFQECRWAWLLHGDDHHQSDLIWVTDRDALLGWVHGAVDSTPEMTYQMLQLGRAASELAKRQVNDADELRRLELLSIKRLMENGPGIGRFERRTVRVVPKSSPL